MAEYPLSEYGAKPEKQESQGVAKIDREDCKPCRQDPLKAHSQAKEKNQQRPPSSRSEVGKTRQRGSGVYLRHMCSWTEECSRKPPDPRISRTPEREETPMKTTVPHCAAVLFLIAGCVDNPTQPVSEPGFHESQTVVGAEVSEASSVIERITGSGHYTTPGIGLNPDTWRVFTMNALKMADGTVKGSFRRVVHEPGQAPQKASGTITCFTVIDNVAWVGGHVDGQDPPDIAWQVVDNGQGSKAAADEVGLQFDAVDFPFEAGFAQDFCEETPDGLDFGPLYGGWVPLFAIRAPVEAGNIQIHVQ